MNPVIIGTGLSGLVGSRLVEMYQDKYDFENLDLTTGVDITDYVAVEKAISESSGEAVVHFAAFTNVNAAQEQNGDKDGVCYKVNVVGTKNIADACKKFDKYLIHISTDFIFDGESGDPKTEKDTPNPIEWYGETKLLAEKEVENSGVDYSILRLAYPYRAFHSERPDMVRNILQRLRDGNMYPAFDDHTITPVFIDDISNVIDIVVNKKPENQTYHLVGSSWHTDFEITQLIQEVFDLPGEIKAGSLAEYLKSNPRPYQKTQKISNQKIIDELGYAPKNFREGLIEVKKQMENLN